MKPKLVEDEEPILDSHTCQRKLTQNAKKQSVFT